VKVLFSPLIAANAISLLENLTKAYPRKMQPQDKLGENENHE